MAKKDVELCIMPDCGNPKRYKVSGLCDRCYAFTRRWSGRSAAKIMARADQIEFWGKRIKTIIPKNVERITTKKRKRA